MLYDNWIAVLQGLTLSARQYFLKFYIVDLDLSQEFVFTWILKFWLFYLEKNATTYFIIICLNAIVL